MYKSTKTYGHDLGLSACFRQWKATSHCRFLHGYPLSFKFTFGAETLDKNNWVVDFGGLKEVKAWLVEHFDHRLVIAADDPAKDTLLALGDEIHWCDIREGDPIVLADPIVIPDVGCEAFAKFAADFVEEWLLENFGERVVLLETEVREHGGNSAIYESYVR